LIGVLKGKLQLTIKVMYSYDHNLYCSSKPFKKIVNEAVIDNNSSKSSRTVETFTRVMVTKMPETRVMSRNTTNESFFFTVSTSI
jgi:hypothetical protein